jgi:hypothetical protein
MKLPIIIAGDSWSHGEYVKKKNWELELTHLGIQQYFQDDGYKVTNLSGGNFSPQDSINSLKNILINPSDIIIWFQSDPLRNFRPYDNFKEILTSYENILSVQNNILIKTYTELNNFGNKIFCVGGNSKLNMFLIKNYKNLIPVCESIPEMLFNDFKHPEIWVSDWIDMIDRSILLDTIDKILESKRWLDDLHLEKYAEYFGEDGIHPNRKAHRKIYESLLEKINGQLP